MGDVRDFVASHKYTIAPDTPLEKMKQIVKEDFGANIGIWGSVERAAGLRRRHLRPGHQVRRFRRRPAAVDLRVQARTNTRQRNPAPVRQGDARRPVRAQAGRARGHRSGGRRELEEQPEPGHRRRFRAGPAALPSAGSRRPARSRRLGNLAKWTAEKGNPGNKVLRMDIPKDVAESLGVMYYSRPFKVEEGAKYRFQCRYRTDGPRPRSSSSATTTSIRSTSAKHRTPQRAPPPGPSLSPASPAARARPARAKPTSWTTMLTTSIRPPWAAAPAAARWIPRSRPAPANATAASRTSRAAGQVEHPDRGLHPQAHQVQSPGRPGDALRLPQGGLDRMGRRGDQADRPAHGQGEG